MNFKDWTTIEEHLAVLFVILIPESVVRANADPAFESSGRNALMTRSRQTKPAPESKAFSFDRGMHDFFNSHLYSYDIVHFFHYGNSWRHRRS